MVSVRKLKISALPANLPDDITVDVTSLQIGKRIVAGDLEIENVNVVSPKATIICSVKATRASKVRVPACGEPSRKPCFRPGESVL